MKNKFLSCILIVAMLGSMIPISADAATTIYYYKFKVETMNIDSAGTGSKICGGFKFHGGEYGPYKCKLDSNQNDFEIGDIREYDVLNTNDPWMIKDIYLWSDCKGRGAGWAPGKVDISRATSNVVSGSDYVKLGVVDFSKPYQTWLKKGTQDATRDCSDMTSRKISSCGGFDDWTKICYLNSESTGKLEKTWDGKITDQYGNYNPWDHDDKPTLTCTSSDNAISAYTFVDGTKETPSFNMDYKGIYQQMIKAGIGKVTFTFDLTFPERSTYTKDGNKNVHTEIITVYRRCFETGNQSIVSSPIYNARTDYNYFNNDNQDVTITLEPTSIHCETPEAKQKKDLANNFKCTAALYAGNSTTNKLCDMKYTVAQDGVLIFNGKIPQKATTNGEGVMLYLKDVNSLYDGYKYDLNSGDTTLEYYFSDYKADTDAPTISTVDSNGTAFSLTNMLKHSHTFWMVGSEKLYPEKEVEHTPINEGYFNYELYKYNESTSGYSTDKAEITNYDGSSDSSYITVKAPIGTTVLKDTPINLKLDSKDEGKFKIRIYAYDDANNTLEGYGPYYEIEDVLIDNQAPRVTVEEDLQNQAVDGTKSANYTFNISDYANSFTSNENIWARAYYCFVPDGDEMPSPDVSNTESGELGTVIGQWAFIEGGSATMTAVIKVNKDSNFKGKLYYFTLDSCNNNSKIENGSVNNMDILVNNGDSKDTLIYTSASYAKPSYEISFSNDGGKLKTEYHWIGKNTASGFSQNYITYNTTTSASVGAAIQENSDGNEVTLNGVYTLEYKVTALSSGNYKVFTKDFTFNNSGTAIDFFWSSDNMNASRYQQANIKTTNLSGIASASYQIVNPDNSVIDGYENIKLDLSSTPDGTMQVSETPQISTDKSGIYEIEIKAEDNNGKMVEMTTSAVCTLFAIRSQKPKVVSITDDAKKIGFTTAAAYTLTVSVEEPMSNANYMSVDQEVKYRVSLDGINYGSWQTADGYMKKSNDKMTHTFKIVKPVPLSQGENTIYVQTACMNVGDASIPSNNFVSDVGKDIIICDVTSGDYEFGKITYRLSTTENTSQPVTAFVTIIDEKNTVVSAKVTDASGTEYPWGEIIGNEYPVIFTTSAAYTVTAFNDKGNTWQKIITISNIDTMLPTITKLMYSVPLDTITTKSVNVQISEFSKPNVKVTRVEVSGELKLSDLVYSPGGTSIRFKKNGSVSVFFEDSQGNKNADIITVSNICSDSPRLKAVPVLSDDKLSVTVTFAQDTDENGVPYDLFRELKDLYIFYGGITYGADKAAFNLKGNGVYKFTIYDSAGSTQYLNLTVDEIDDTVPKITQVTWSYEYYNKSEEGVWELNSDSKTIVIGVDTTGNEAGYIIADDANQVTNQNVIVTVETDKPTTMVGSKNAIETNTSMLYAENGLFNYNLQAKNGNSVSYGVDVEIIDKVAPILQFTGGAELVFIEGMTSQKDSTYVYSMDKLTDYSAYDLKDGKSIDLTDRVTIDYGSFNPKNIDKNTFSRSNPYYINYTVYDDAGNCTTVRRTIRLVGFYDTIVLIDGIMPDSSNTATVADDEMEITLKNFSGASYAKYDKGTYTMGQMKTRGMQIKERNGKYTLSSLDEGWYTVYLQTDKRDYFTILVYVSNSK